MYGPELNKSYFFAIDTRHGWGNTSYFTYFSEFNRPNKHDSYIEAVFLIVLFVCSLIGNVIFIVNVISDTKLRTITNYFVCNLALADILLVSSGPIIAHVRITETWTLGDSMCSYLNYAMFVCGTVMIWTMAVISIDRYICINHSTPSPRRLQSKQIIGVCLLIWCLSFVSFSPIAVYFNTVTVHLIDKSIILCSLAWPRASISISAIFTVCLFTVGYIIPLIIISVNYIRILRKLRAAGRAITHSSQVGSHPVRTGSKRKRNVHVVNTLVILVVLFLLMLTPLFVVFILIQQDISNERFVVPSHALVWVVVVCFTNAFINPFLYGYLNNLLKRRLYSICRWKRRNKLSNGNDNNNLNPVSSVVDRNL